MPASHLDKSSKTHEPTKTKSSNPQRISREISFDKDTNTAEIIERRGSLDLKRIFTLEDGVVYVEDFVKTPFKTDYESTGKRVYDKEVDDVITTLSTLRYPEFKPSAREFAELPHELKQIQELNDRIEKLFKFDSEYTSLKEQIDALEGASFFKQEFLESFYDIKYSIPDAEERIDKIKEQLLLNMNSFKTETNKEIRDGYVKKIAKLRKELGAIEEELRKSKIKIRELRQRFHELKSKVNGTYDYDELIQKLRDGILKNALAYLKKLQSQKGKPNIVVESLIAASKINDQNEYIKSLISSLK